MTWLQESVLARVCCLQWQTKPGGSGVHLFEMPESVVQMDGLEEEGVGGREGARGQGSDRRVRVEEGEI